MTARKWQKIEKQYKKRTKTFCGGKKLYEKRPQTRDKI